MTAMPPLPGASSRDSSPEAVIACKDDGLRAGPDAELVEQVRQVISHRLLTDPKALRDFGIAQPVREERQSFALARRQIGKRLVLRLVLLVRRLTRKRQHRFLKSPPGRLVLEQDVIARFELDELRA